MTVEPHSWVFGWMTTSRPISTSTPIQVVSGSITVAPPRIAFSTSLRLSSLPASASCTRSFTPASSRASGAVKAVTRRPSLRAMLNTSVM